MLTTIPGMDDATVNNQRIFLDLIEFAFLVSESDVVRVQRMTGTWSYYKVDSA